MTEKTIYIIGGLVFLFLSLIGLTRDIDAFKTQMTGDLITVKVTYVPNCLFASDVYYHIKIQYLENGELKEYPKSIGSNLCNELVVGQELKMKADLKKKIFLYEDEDVRNEFYASAVLGLVGLVLLILWFKTKSLHY